MARDQCSLGVLIEPDHATGRSYSPRLGRLCVLEEAGGGRDRRTKRDPLAFDGGDSNLYRYVENNPANRTDPEGYFAGTIVLGPGLAILRIPGLVAALDSMSFATRQNAEETLKRMMQSPLFRGLIEQALKSALPNCTLEFRQRAERVLERIELLNRFDKLLRQMGDKDLATRDKAADELQVFLESGDSEKPYMVNELKKAAQPFLDRINRDPGLPRLPPDPEGYRRGERASWLLEKLAPKPPGP